MVWIHLYLFVLVLYCSQDDSYMSINHLCLKATENKWDKTKQKTHIHRIVRYLVWLLLWSGSRTKPIQRVNLSRRREIIRKTFGPVYNVLIVLVLKFVLPLNTNKTWVYFIKPIWQYKRLFFCNFLLFIFTFTFWLLERPLWSIMAIML